MAKIVIAEDERDIRDLIAFTLRFAGHEVVTAANGEEAVEMAMQENPDLIMLDVRMPRMTGYDACRAIKANPAFVNTPVVFLSAKGQESEIESGLDAGADEYFLKPFAPAELTKRVLEILAKYANETGTDKYANEIGNDKYANETGDDKSANETGDDKYANETGADKYANETGADKYANETGNDKYTHETGDDKYTNETGNDKYANETGTDKYTHETGDDKYTNETGNDKYANETGDE